MPGLTIYSDGSQYDPRSPAAYTSLGVVRSWSRSPTLLRSRLLYRKLAREGILQPDGTPTFRIATAA
jgi:hypothetical protein